MDDKSRKNPQEPIDTKDLPPKKLGKDIEENVKGGAEPISDRKKPKPAEPISDGR
jgi:hypothetical protein